VELGGGERRKIRARINCGVHSRYGGPRLRPVDLSGDALPRRPRWAGRYPALARPGAVHGS